MRSARAVLAMGILASGLAAGRAGAATASASIEVSATVQVSCQASTNATEFGTYSGAAANALSQVSVACSNSTPYTVTLAPGITPGAILAFREMAGFAAAPRGYALSPISRGIVNWGRAAGADPAARPDAGSGQAFAVYDHIRAGRYVAADVFRGAIIFTVTY